MQPTGFRRLALLAVAGLALATSCTAGGARGDQAASTTTAPTATTTPSVPTALDRYVEYDSIEYDDPDHWLCRPDVSDDVCDTDMTATTVAADGSLTPDPWAPDPDTPIDCFYVYPTVSRDPTPSSDWDTSDGDETYPTVNQAARLASECRLFVPVYRQITTTALAGRAVDGPEADPYADVLDAFRTYMARDNDGRGFVLAGHSQGTVWAKRLIAEEVDPNPDVRSLLVGAYLAGGKVNVRAGEATGGDFDNVPVCRDEGEAGCVFTWSSFTGDGGPEPDPTSATEVACASPAAPSGGEAAFDTYFASSTGAAVGPGADGEGGGTWVEGDDAPQPTTPWVHLPGLASGGCTGDGSGYLSVDLDADPDDPRADSLPLFDLRGADLHLIDVNLVMGDVVAQVRIQAEAYLAE